jgi:hypothetical protein
MFDTRTKTTTMPGMYGHGDIYPAGESMDEGTDTPPQLVVYRQLLVCAKLIGGSKDLEADDRTTWEALWRWIEQRFERDAPQVRALHLLMNGEAVYGEDAREHLSDLLTFLLEYLGPPHND